MSVNGFLTIFFSLNVCLLNGLIAQETFYYKYDNQPQSDEIEMGQFSNGDLLIAGKGYHFRSQENPYFLSRISSNGKVKWSKGLQFQTSSHLPRLTVTNQDQIFLANTKAITKLTADGKIDWSHHYGFAESNRDTIFPMLEGSQNKIWIYGYFHSWFQQGKELLVKMDTSGKVLFAKQISKKRTSGQATLTPKGRLVLLRRVDANPPYLSILKVKNSGKVIWAKKVKSRLNYALNPLTDEDGNILITLTNRNQTRIRPLKLNANGQNFIWKQDSTLFISSFSGSATFTHQTLDARGNCWITGKKPIGDVKKRVYPLLTKLKRNGQYDSTKLIHQTNSDYKSVGISGPTITYSPNSPGLFIAGKYIDDKGKIALFCFKNAINKVRESRCLRGNYQMFDSSRSLTLRSDSLALNDYSGIRRDTVKSSTLSMAINPDTLCLQCKDFDVSIVGDSVICADKKAVLTTKKSYDSMYWSNGKRSPGIQVKNPGQYWVQAFKACGRGTDSQFVRKIPFPEFQYHIKPEEAKPEDTVFFSDSTKGIQQRTWYINGDSVSNKPGFQRIFKNVQNHQITLAVEDTVGCHFRQNDTVKIRFFSFYMPNAFSPNGDGVNEAFGPVGYGIKDYELTIFNRWGQRLFRGSSEEWKGEFRNKTIPAGQYIYQITVTDFKGDKHYRDGVFKVLK